MSAPRRVRVPGPFRRAELPKGTTYVGRGVLGYPRSPFNNPFPVPKKVQVAKVEVDGVTVRVRDRAHAIELYRRYLRQHPELVERARKELVGQDLACWCKPDEQCHADVVLSVVAGKEP